MYELFFPEECILSSSHPKIFFPEECIPSSSHPTNVGKLQSIGTRRRWRSNLQHLRLAAQHSDAITTAPQHHSQKRMVWTQLRPILCAVYHDTVLSPDVATVAAQHCYPLRRHCSCSRTVCICNRLDTPTWFCEPYPWRKYCVSRRCHQFWKIAVDWHTPTVGIEPTAPPPSHSAVQHTDCRHTKTF